MPEVQSEPDKELLSEMMSLKSHTPEGADAVARLLYDRFRKLGIGNVTLQEVTGRYATGKKERYNLIVDIPAEGPVTDETTVLYGHHDVVPPSEDYATLGHNPHELRFKAKKPNQLYGLGCADMLSGIVAIEHACRMRVQEGRGWSNRAIRFICVYDEEIESAGYKAAQEGGYFDDAAGVLTPEILVNHDLMKDNKKRALILGRPGLFSFTISSKGLEKHAGAITPEDKPRRTLALSRAAEDIVESMVENGLLTPHPDGQGMVNRPNVEILNRGINGKESLTVHGEEWFTAYAHYVNPNETPMQVVAKLREMLADIAMERFPGGGNNAKKMRDRAYAVNLGDHLVGFSKPSREDKNHPFVRNIRTHLAEACRRFGPAKRTDTDSNIVRRLCDTGTADCPRIVHDCNIPVLGIPIMSGKGAHTAYETLYWPDVRENSEVMALALEQQRPLAPRDWAM